MRKTKQPEDDTKYDKAYFIRVNKRMDTFLRQQHEKAQRARKQRYTFSEFLRDCILLGAEDCSSPSRAGGAELLVE